MFVYFYLATNFGEHAMENSVKATVDSLRLPTFLEFELVIPDGHFKFPHLWPVKFPQAGRLNYQLFGLAGFGFLSWLFLPDFFGFLINGCLASAARQALSLIHI